jgi:very-short-patch-repair endonuclease
MDPRADYEYERSLALQARGIAVVRIPNELLIRDSLMVEEMIRFAIDSRR